MRGDVDLCNEKMRKKAKLQPLHVVPHSPAGTISVYCDSPSALLSAPTLDASGEKCMCCYHTTLKEQVQEDTKSEEEEAYDLMVKGGLIFMKIILDTAYACTHIHSYTSHVSISVMK